MFSENKRIEKSQGTYENCKILVMSESKVDETKHIFLLLRYIQDSMKVLKVKM